MTRLRRWAAVTIGPLAVALLAGCAPLFAVCAMPDIRPPHVTIDASIWLRLHSGGMIDACYAGSCAHEDGTSSSFEVLALGKVDPTKKHALVVTLKDQSGTTTETASIALRLVPGQKGGPCPMPDQWSREVLIGTDGRMQVGGADDGRIIIPSPEEPTGSLSKHSSSAP